MIQTLCPICKKKGDNEILKVQELFLPTRKIFQYLFCRECESLSLLEIPKDLNSYYADYFSFKEKPPQNSYLTSLVKKTIIKNSGNFSRFLTRFLGKNEDLRISACCPLTIDRSHKILDVGCGSGAFINELHQLGFANVLGIDAYLDKDFNFPWGGKCLKASIFDISEKYDLITFHHTLEHMEDIESVLTKISELLSPLGTCIIRIPNVSSYGFKIFKKHWFSIHPPFHLRLPSIKYMKNISDKTGLFIEKILGEENPEFTAINIGFSREMSLQEIFTNGLVFQKNFVDTLSENFSKKDIKFCRNFYHLTKDQPENCNWIVYYMRKKSAKL